MVARVESAADAQVQKCIEEHRSFAMIAGAGSGKTSSLVDALGRIRDREGRALKTQGQRIACITFTKRAVEVIKARLGFDDLYLVSTLHSFQESGSDSNSFALKLVFLTLFRPFSPIKSAASPMNMGASSS